MSKALLAIAKLGVTRPGFKRKKKVVLGADRLEKVVLVIAAPKKHCLR